MATEDIDQLIDEIIGMLGLQLHPENDRLGRETVEWFDTLDLSGLTPDRHARLRMSDFGSGTGAAYPSAEYTTAFWWARFSTLLLIMDDWYAEGTAAGDLPTYFERAGELWCISQHTLPPTAPSSAMGAVLEQLLNELDTLVDDVVATRVRQAFRDMLFAMAWEAAATVTERPPDWDVYRNFHRYFGLFVVCLEFIEHLPGLLLSEAERRDSRIHMMRAAACDMVGAINELCSAKFEIATGNALFPDGSVDRTGDYLEGLPERCRALARKVLDVSASLEPDRKLGSYGTALTRWAVGIAWWHQQALRHRYQVPGGRADID